MAYDFWKKNISLPSNNFPVFEELSKFTQGIFAFPIFWHWSVSTIKPKWQTPPGSYNITLFYGLRVSSSVSGRPTKPQQLQPQGFPQYGFYLLLPCMKWHSQSLVQDWVERCGVLVGWMRYPKANESKRIFFPLVPCWFLETFLLPDLIYGHVMVRKDGEGLSKLEMMRCVKETLFREKKIYAYPEEKRRERQNKNETRYM